MIRLLALLALALALAATFSPAALAQDEAPAISGVAEVAPPNTPAGQGLQWVLDGMNGDEDVKVEGKFADAVLQQVDVAQLEAGVNTFRAQSGGFDLVRVDEMSPLRLIAVAQARADASFWRIIVSVEEAEPHLFNGLLFQPAPDEGMASFDSWDDAWAALEPLGERASLVIYEVKDGELSPIFEKGGEQRLAMGSTFKLWIAGALAEAIEAGEFEWDQMIMIEDRLRSLPSGRMQDLAHGEERPLEEYATLMIAISDNTATDHMLDLVGRERVEAFMSRFVAEPDRNLPFLSTREIFTIKLDHEHDLMHRYAEATPEQRREILESEVIGKTPNIMDAGSWTAPRAIDTIEWFATGRELCETMLALWNMADRERLASMRTVLGSNNGLGLSAADWPRVAFKGGSEPGVMSLTWVLERADGRVFSVSMTVNDTTNLLDEMRVVGVAKLVMQKLANE